MVNNNSWEEVDFVNWDAHCAVDHVEHGQCDPSFCTGSNSEYTQFITEYWSFVTDWTVPEEKKFIIGPDIGSPDLYSVENTHPSAGSPRSGTKWLSTAREAVVIQLEESLTPGCDYYIEIFSKRGNGNGYCSVSAYDRHPRHLNAQGRDIEQSNSAHHEKLLEWDTNDPEFHDEWHKVSTFFSVTEERNWITVAGKGEFDDIKIYKVPDLCADHWSLDNYEFYWDGTLGNTGNPNDCLNSPTDIYNYTLSAKNCQTIPHCETGLVIEFGCYLEDWDDSIWVAKSQGSFYTNTYGGAAIEFDAGRTTPEIDMDGNSIDPHENSRNGAVKMYPNPSNNLVLIDGTELTILKIDIYDGLGRLVTSTTSLKVDISELSDGTYMVKILTSAGVKTKSLIVAKH